MSIGSRGLVASDLDRTLIYSAKALALGDPVSDPVCVERYLDGEQSFLSARALAGLGELSLRAEFVPVTTRTVEQYRRIRFPGVRVGHAITTNGAIILDDGRPCGDWTARVAQRLTEVTPYVDARAKLAPLLVGDWVRGLRDADEFFLYVLLHPELIPSGWVDEVSALADGLGWTSSLQGRKLYLIPRTLTKEAALAEVAARTGAESVLAAGDSLLDKGLLLAADRAIRPAHGELHEQGWRPEGIDVTRHAGGLAADEIVAWFGVDYGICLT